MKTKSMILFIIGVIIIIIVLSIFLGVKYYKEAFSGSFSGKFISDNNVNNANDANDANSANNSNTMMMMDNKYDNYNHYSGFSSTLTNGATFYGKNGGSAMVNIQNDGKPSLKVTLDSNNSPMVFTPVAKEGFTKMNDSSVTKFTGPNGYSATIINLNGQQAIRVQSSSGSHIFTTSESKSTSEYNPNYQTYNNTPNTYYGSTGDVYSASSFANNAYTSPITYYGENGSTATVNSNGPNTLTVKLNGNTIEYGGTPDATGFVSKYQGPNLSTAVVVTGENGVKSLNITYNGKTMTFVSSGQQPQNNNFMSMFTPQQSQYSTQNQTQNQTPNPMLSTNSLFQTPNSNQQGISRSQIPPGQEDLYILKSEIVPPVCPACPAAASCPRQEKCPPCPACARCPEPSFECKKVPNYNAMNTSGLPMPVLNDFSSFGM
jgi:hypothetical protein